MSQSQALTNFYNAYNDWLNDGAPNTHIFFRTFNGLCSALQYYTCDMSSQEKVRLYVEMKTQFEKARLDAVHPFNDGALDYRTEVLIHARAHLNPKRIQWVRDHLSVES